MNNHGENRRRILCFCFLLLWAIGVVSLTLLPPDFEWNLEGRRVLTVEISDAADILDIALNIALFCPFGFLAWFLKPRHTDRFRFALLVVGISGSLSLGIEWFQQFLPFRDSSLIDVLFNSAGALAGLSLAPKIIEACRRRPHVTPVQSWTILTGCAVALLVVSGLLQYGTRLTNWDDAFYLMIGNERTGDRPWKGRVLRVDLSPEAVSADTIRRFASATPIRVPQGDLVRLSSSPNQTGNYNLTGLPAMIPQSSRNSASETTGPFVRWFRSVDPPRQLARAVRASNSFTLRLTCSSDDPNQDGPARIFSYSADTQQRNLTIGQQGSELVVRIRTQGTGLNGTLLQIVLPDIFVSRNVRDMLITYENSRLSIAIAGTGEPHVFEFSPGAVLASLYLFPHYRQFGRFKLAYYCLCFLLLFGCLSWLTTTPSRYLSVAPFITAVFAVLLECDLAIAAQRSIEISNVLVGLTAGSAIALVLFALVFKLVVKTDLAEITVHEHPARGR